MRKARRSQGSPGWQRNARSPLQRQARSGIDGTCYGPVAERIHGVDECVEIASIRHVLTTYALFISRGAALAESASSRA